MLIPVSTIEIYVYFLDNRDICRYAVAYLNVDMCIHNRDICIICLYDLISSTNE
jgi:hypothetical protein